MILGVDPGERRVGIAAADDETRFARPVEVIDIRTTDPVQRIRTLVAEMEVELVVVGRPVTLRGEDGPAVVAARSLTDALRSALEVEVVEHDERLTTLVADQGMKAAGTTSASRKRMRDAVAAQVLLQGFLDGGGG